MKFKNLNFMIFEPHPGNSEKISPSEGLFYEIFPTHVLFALLVRSRRASTPWTSPRSAREMLRSWYLWCVKLRCGKAMGFPRDMVQKWWLSLGLHIYISWQVDRRVANWCVVFAFFWHDVHIDCLLKQGPLYFTQETYIRMVNSSWDSIFIDPG